METTRGTCADCGKAVLPAWKRCTECDRARRVKHMRVEKPSKPIVYIRAFKDPAKLSELITKAQLGWSDGALGEYFGVDRTSIRYQLARLHIRKKKIIVRKQKNFPKIRSVNELKEQPLNVRGIHTSVKSAFKKRVDVVPQEEWGTHNNPTEIYYRNKQLAKKERGRARSRMKYTTKVKSVDR